MKMYATFLHALLHARSRRADGAGDQRAQRRTEPAPSPPIRRWSFRARNRDCPRSRSAAGTSSSHFIRARPELWLWNYKHWRYQPRNAGSGISVLTRRVNEPFERVLRGEPGPWLPNPRAGRRSKSCELRTKPVVRNVLHPFEKDAGRVSCFRLTCRRRLSAPCPEPQHHDRPRPITAAPTARRCAPHGCRRRAALGAPWARRSTLPWPRSKSWLDWWGTLTPSSPTAWKAG